MDKNKKKKQKIEKGPEAIRKPARISIMGYLNAADNEETINEDAAIYISSNIKDYLGYTVKDYIDPNNISFEYLYGENSVSASALIFNKLPEITHLTNKILAGQVFELTTKTLNTYKNSNSKIPMRVRELSIKLSELYIIGSRVFGSTDNFNMWLNKPSYGLGGIVPLELLNTITGMDLIFDELVSIEFGTTA